MEKLCFPSRELAFKRVRQIDDAESVNYSSFKDILYIFIYLVI